MMTNYLVISATECYEEVNYVLQIPMLKNVFIFPFFRNIEFIRKY